ncbi:MAG: glycosyltransferase family 4 protein [Fibrobacter sp.]|nr:glycosyltransferase family 4 protein [Fibrobacter sp.]
MKIAFFNKNLPSDQPNGVSVQVHRLAQALVRKNHQVTVFSFSPAPSDALYDHIHLSWGNGTRLFKKFKPAILFRSSDKEPFDILHYHGDDYLCKGERRRVRTFYGTALQEAIHAANPGRFMYQSLFYFFEWVSCLKRGSFAAISESTFRSLPLVKRCIPCGVPLDKYNPGTSEKTRHPSILFIGDLDSRKRGRLLVQKFVKDVLPANPECTLKIVGPQPFSGPNIIYAGRLGEDELVEEYRRSWIYCLPSSYEGFGVPVLESMACGTPVVATANAGVKEIITDGKNGLLCSASSLGETINQLLADTVLCKQITKNGLESVRSFDIETIASKYEELYMQLI